MRAAYADPPYIGQAKKHYKGHPDYAGEVNHEELIARLEAEFEGWALSASIKSLPVIMRLAPENVLTLAWVKPIAPPMGDHRHYSWEPVVFRPIRKPATYERMHHIESPPQFTFRDKPKGHVIGEKPEGFCMWVFRCLGLLPEDQLTDLYPGSGAVQKAWLKFKADPALREAPNAD